jgi:hypothetical protein
VPVLNQLATTPYDDTDTYGDKVHFVHIYIVEPHPMDPDVSPYSGEVWETEYSTKRQPTIYDERVAAAGDIQPLLEGNQLILVDELDNPVWCSYGPCPNCAYLISQSGIVDTVQSWVDGAEMQQTIDQLLQ